MPKVSRLEVIQTGSRRRWTLEEKRRIVAESDSGTRQVSATARRYGLVDRSVVHLAAAGQRKGRLGGDAEPVAFAEAVIVDRGAAAAALPPPAGACGRMEIVLADGLRVIVEQGVDPNALACLIGALERDDDSHPERRQGLDRDLPYPHAPRHAKPGSYGSGEFEARSSRWRSLHLPGPPGPTRDILHTVFEVRQLHIHGIPFLDERFKSHRSGAARI